MSTVAGQMHRNQSSEDLFAELTPLRVRLNDEVSIRAYLRDFPDLVSVIPPICTSTRNEFGVRAELFLTVRRDPEIQDEHLALIVRLPAYSADMVERLSKIMTAHEQEICKQDGTFLVTTDFHKL